MALTDKLSSIADAIRDKTGKTELLTLDQMPTEIAGIETGGGGSDLPEEAFNITGNCKYRFSNGGWDWFIEGYGDKITTSGITDCSYMFNLSDVAEIPFEINLNNNGISGTYMFESCENLIKISKINGKLGATNAMFRNCYNLIEVPDLIFDNSTYATAERMFYDCNKLKESPYLYHLYPSMLSYLFYGCEYVRSIPEDYMDTWNFDRIYSYRNSNIATMFSSCYSLRNIPSKILSKLHNDTATSASYKFYYAAFFCCYSLDGIIGLAVDGASLTNNVFSNTFNNCARLKNMTFETNADGTPKTANWKSQTIDLSDSVGYFDMEYYKIHILDYNSGITADKEVTDDATYQALKNDPDWFSCNIAYSRYNHDSAVETINSLPDCSASGGTNTIKFKGAAGELTDGGAINTLTEEEIAVAVSRGWTVTLI